MIDPHTSNLYERVVKNSHFEEKVAIKKEPFNTNVTKLWAKIFRVTLKNRETIRKKEVLKEEIDQIAEIIVVLVDLVNYKVNEEEIEQIKGIAMIFIV